MISEIVDRVALAMILEADGGERQWRALARAAIMEMREPTADMVRCGCGWGMGLAEPDVIKGWQGMIDAALLADKKACLPPPASPADRVGGTAP